MAARDLATAFYPERIEADPEALTVLVTGELATWIGREPVSRERKRYRLVFRVDASRSVWCVSKSWRTEHEAREENQGCKRPGPGACRGGLHVFFIPVLLLERSFTARRPRPCRSWMPWTTRSWKRRSRTGR